MASAFVTAEFERLRGSFVPRYSSSSAAVANHIGANSVNHGGAAEAFEEIDVASERKTNQRGNSSQRDHLVLAEVTSLRFPPELACNLYHPGVLLLLDNDRDGLVTLADLRRFTAAASELQRRVPRGEFASRMHARGTCELLKICGTISSNDATQDGAHDDGANAFGAWVDQLLTMSFGRESVDGVEYHGHDAVAALHRMLRAAHDHTWQDDDGASAVGASAAFGDSPDLLLSREGANEQGGLFAHDDDVWYGDDVGATAEADAALVEEELDALSPHDNDNDNDNDPDVDALDVPANALDRDASVEDPRHAGGLQAFIDVLQRHAEASGSMPLMDAALDDYVPLATCRAAAASFARGVCAAFADTFADHILQSSSEASGTKHDASTHQPPHLGTSLPVVGSGQQPAMSRSGFGIVA
ncbi:hypothetical protein NFJ02_03g101800 [Pycnococcus provasolii]